MIALIDGDIVAYKNAAITERTWYEVDGSEFRYKTEAINFCYAEDIPTSEIHPYKVYEPLSHTVHNIDAMMQRILKDTGADEYKVFLTGTGNYRYQIAVTRPYKGTRDPSKTPSNLADAREYLISTYGGILVDGAEADDAMGIEQTNAMSADVETIICSTDKDMKMIPGWHHDFKKTYFVDEHAANLAFYTQLLTGDTVDNIVGLCGCGPKTAANILKNKFTPKEMYLSVQAAYDKVHGAGAKDVLEENANLLWIQREEGVLWTPPK